MRVPTIRGTKTPSVLFSNIHTFYNHLSTSITNMAAPLEHEDELWPQFKASAQAVTDAFKKYVGFEIPSSSMRLTTWRFEENVLFEIGRAHV